MDEGGWLSEMTTGRRWSMDGGLELGTSLRRSLFSKNDN